MSATAEKERKTLKLKEIIKSTLNCQELIYEGKPEDLNWFQTMCFVGGKGYLFQFGGSDLCVLNYDFDGIKSILLVFGLPISGMDEEDKKKTTTHLKDINERLFDIISFLEDVFITLDFIYTRDSTEDKRRILFVIKKLDKGIKFLEKK